MELDATDHSHFIQLTVLSMTMGWMKNYNYLIADIKHRQAVIIDPAWEMPKIDAALQHVDCELIGILLTHSHPDHIHLSKPLAAKHSCPIWMSERECVYSGYKADELLYISQSPWRIADITIEPIFTPGHTPGSVCFKIGNNLFTGDVLFAEGCGLCPNEQAAYEMFESLQRLKEYCHAETRIYPGHSYGLPPGQTYARIQQSNIYLNFSDKNSFARFRLRKNQQSKKFLEFK